MALLWELKTLSENGCCREMLTHCAKMGLNRSYIYFSKILTDVGTVKPETVHSLSFKCLYIYCNVLSVLDNSFLAHDGPLYVRQVLFVPSFFVFRVLPRQLLRMLKYCESGKGWKI